jgi:aromatic amino acid aminotransferase I
MTADNRPMAVDLSHHLSLLARSRHPSPLKDLIRYMGVKGIISFAGGLPAADFFPMHSLSASLYPADTVLDPENPSPPDASVDFTIPRRAAAPAYDIERGLQYVGGRGLTDLETPIRALTEKVWPPAYADWDVLLNNGSTDGWIKILTLLVESGDYIICDSQIYPSAQAGFVPMGVKAHPVPGDGEGMCPEALAKGLEEWDESKGRRPRIMYSVPVGQNPLGTTMGPARRKAIYDVCVKYDVIIIEDDPYCMLQFPPYVVGQKSAPPAPKADVDAFLSNMSSSFLTIDTQGRVIRMDTFSKTLFPGARLGWFTCNAMFTERLLRGTEVQTQGPSGFSEIITGELLNKWGVDGFLEWNTNLCEQYRVRRDWMLDALAAAFDLVPAEEAGVPGAIGLVGFPKGRSGPAILSFVPPVGGMFIWCKAHYDTHPAWAGFQTDKTDQERVRAFEEKFWIRLVDALILVTPGWYFSPWEGGGHSLHEEGSGHFRLAYSFEPKNNVDEGIRRLADVMTKEWTGEVDISAGL